MSHDEKADPLARTWYLLQKGLVSQAIYSLRFVAEKAPLNDVAEIVRLAAGMMKVDDLVQVATQLQAEPDNPAALYDFGYGCIERGIPFIAIPALKLAHQIMPQSKEIIGELVTAYEEESRHADAVALLDENANYLDEWFNRYLLTFNIILTGNIARAQQEFARLAKPTDPQFAPHYSRIAHILGRIDAAKLATSFDLQDVRGWHFALNGAILSILSPYGFNEGMNGRFAYQQGTFSLCHQALLRLKLILQTAGEQPQSISLLPDRSSEILGLAAAEILQLPAKPWNAEDANSLVIVYASRNLDTTMIKELRQRPAQQILFEHATCWTEPGRLSVDISTFLHQIAIAPWDERPTMLTQDGMITIPADDRPIQTVAQEILNADPAPDQGDPDAPLDTDENLTAFVNAIKSVWPRDSATRDKMWTPGPVKSNQIM